MKYSLYDNIIIICIIVWTKIFFVAKFFFPRIIHKFNSSISYSLLMKFRHLFPGGHTQLTVNLHPQCVNDSWLSSIYKCFDTERKGAWTVKQLTIDNLHLYNHFQESCRTECNPNIWKKYCHKSILRFVSRDKLENYSF